MSKDKKPPNLKKGFSTIGLSKDLIPPYSVCTGKAITTKRGILSDGDFINENDFSDGVKTLKKFLKSKHIQKN